MIPSSEYGFSKYKGVWHTVDRNKNGLWRDGGCLQYANLTFRVSWGFPRHFAIVGETAEQSARLLTSTAFNGFEGRLYFEVLLYEVYLLALCCRTHLDGYLSRFARNTVGLVPFSPTSKSRGSRQEEDHQMSERTTIAVGWWDESKDAFNRRRRLVVWTGRSVQARESPPCMLDFRNIFCARWPFFFTSRVYTTDTDVIPTYARQPAAAREFFLSRIACLLGTRSATLECPRDHPQAGRQIV